MNPNLEVALRLAARGLRVAFGHRPVDGRCTCGSTHAGNPNSIGKHPIGKAWQRLASSDAQALNDAFIAIDHACNVGLVLGPCDAGYIIAIDVDDAEVLASLVQKFGELPATLTGRSPRGARLFFSISESDASEIKNITALGGSPGVDVKVKGGFVVVGPSLHSSGGSYSWDDIDASIATLPVTWMQAVLPPPKPQPTKYTASAPTTNETNRVRKWAQAIARREAERVAQAPEGQRNAVLYNAACRTFPAVFEAGLSGFDARAELTSAAKAAGLGEKEIALTIKSAEDWVTKNDVRRKPPDVPRDPGIGPDLRIVGNSALQPETSPDFPELIIDRGQPAKIAGNVMRMLAKFPGGTTRYNEFTDRVTWASGKPIKDTDAVDVQTWLTEQSDSIRVRVSPETIHLALVRYAEDHSYHPVREYLRSLTWDNESRVERLFLRAFGVQDSPYIRAVSKCFMIGAVARIMKPGCKHDAMPVLEGAPGLLKSTALRTLAGDDWFSDTPITPGDKDAYQSLIGVWIYEHAELSNIRGREAERVNAYMSSAKDHYRKSYGRVAEDVPRQSVFAGTTNSNDYISSHESDGQRRRFWPVPCTKIDIPLIRDYRDQLWAEAVAMYDHHERWWLPGDVRDAHAELTEDRHSPDPWIESIARLEPKEHTMGEVLMLCGVDPGKRSVLDEKRVSPLLKKAGWHPFKTKRNGVHIRFWVPSSYGN